MVVFTIAVLGALAYATSLAPPREADADTPAPVHMLVAGHSSKALDVPGADDRPGTRLVQWRAHGGDNQLFRTLPFVTGDLNFVIIRSVETGHVLDMGPGQGDPVFQGPWTGSASQVWWVASFGATRYALFVNMGSGHVLEVEGSSLADGAAIVQSPWRGGANQLWRAAIIID
ncbi:MAG: RICIN domain-containing protein [Actinomycetota bacterium]|nr:RICIN domain-containing protein [Actinomycetota bacterium]